MREKESCPGALEEDSFFFGGMVVMIPWKMKRVWRIFWLSQGGIGMYGRFASLMGGCFSEPYYGRVSLAKYSQRGFVSPLATVSHEHFLYGDNVFLDDRVLIYCDYDGGAVALDDRVCVFRDTIMQTGQGGTIELGSDTSVQAKCLFSAYKGLIKIGKDVQIAPSCSFYSYDHSLSAGTLVRSQPLKSKGGIVVEDDSWIGVNAVLLDGVTVGKGAVVGAGSVVNSDIPPMSIACGVPARVVKMRVS